MQRNISWSSIKYLCSVVSERHFNCTCRINHSKISETLLTIPTVYAGSSFITDLVFIRSMTMNLLGNN